MPNSTNPLAPGSPGFFPGFDGNDQLTASQLLNPITEIPATIYALNALNQGYFLQDLFAAGPTVTGGAASVTEDDPQNLFLDADRGFAPRAPGADAAEIGASHGDKKMYAVENWSGWFRVADEVVRRNRVDEVRDILQRASNSWGDRLQLRGLAIANAFLTAKSRQVAAPFAWTIAHANGVPNEDPAKLPAAGLSLALAQFTKDKAGITPNTAIINPDDGVTWDTVYGAQGPAVWERYGLTPKTSVLQPKGTVTILASGRLGVLLPEKDMDVETERKGKARSTDYSLDGSFVMAPKNAGAAIQLTAVSS